MCGNPLKHCTCPVCGSKVNERPRKLGVEPQYVARLEVTMDVARIVERLQAIRNIKQRFKYVNHAQLVIVSLRKDAL